MQRYGLYTCDEFLVAVNKFVYSLHVIYLTVSIRSICSIYLFLYLFLYFCSIFSIFFYSIYNLCTKKIMYKKK